MNDRKTGRNADGTFIKGNSGKPKGARDKATLAVMAFWTVKWRHCPVRRSHWPYRAIQRRYGFVSSVSHRPEEMRL